MWLNFLRKTRNQPRPASFRPHLEALEDRCLLSGGALDPTFGSGGLVTTGFGSSDGKAYAVATYPNSGTANDGKIVAAGYSQKSAGAYHFAVVRYNLDGTLDPSFGGSGHVTNPSGVANDVKVQPDGKIVAAGWSANNFAVVRYNVNGTLDSTFGGKGTKGEVLTDIGQQTNDGAGRLALQSDGKIVVAGWTAAGNTSSYDLALVRYDADGSLDTSFGIGGKVIQHLAFPLWQPNVVTGAIDMAIDPGTGPLDPNAGKIVVDAPLSVYPHSVAVVRFNTNGALDLAFGGGAGYVTTTSANLESFGVAVQSDDRIVVGGTAVNDPSTGYDIRLARLNPDGAPDTTFGSGGTVVTPLPGDQFAKSLTIQPDGKIVVAGGEIDNFIDSFMVARYNAADGGLDTSFGVNGIVVGTGVRLAYTPSYPPMDVALEPDGRIVVAGSQDFKVTGYYNFAVARLLATGPQIGSFTASPNPVPVGSSVTLTAANITDRNPGSTVTQVVFYYFDSSGNKVNLGSSSASNGVWTYAVATTGWASGTYALFAQADDNYGVFSDPLALTLHVL